MPVQSKILGRARKPPPAPGPKPILKQSKGAQRPNSVTGYPTSASSPILGRTPRPFLSPTPYTAPRSEISPVHQPSVSFRSSFSEENASTESNREFLSKPVSVPTDLPNADGESDDVFEEGFEDTHPERNRVVEGKQARKDIRPRLSGAQALSECEDHTDWVNDILSQNKLPRILDLRKSIGDGYTLPTILEIISGITLHCVKLHPSTKESRVENLRKCLVFLCKHGADITDIDPLALEDGNLTSILTLLWSVRRHFKTPGPAIPNGYADLLSCPPVSPSHGRYPVQVTQTPSAGTGMPGAMKLPGAIPTPFQAGQDHLPLRNNMPSSPTRKHATYTDGEILPGMLGQEQNHDATNKSHTTLISNTELGSTCVAQHGVEERRVHLAHTGESPPGAGPGRGILLRHPNAKVSRPNTEHPLPTGVTRAWTGSPRPQANGASSSRNSNSIEDRLRQLINSSNKSNNPAAAAAASDMSRDNQAGDGLFHGGGSEVFNDDDLLVIPPPAPKSNTPPGYEHLFGEHGYGPGYRNASNSYVQRGHRSHGYVPSKPSDKRQGARADTLLQGQQGFTSSTGGPVTQQQQALPGRTIGGRDFYGYPHNAPVQNPNVHSAPSQNPNFHNGPSQTSNFHNGPSQTVNMHNGPTKNSNLHSGPTQHSNLHSGPNQNSNIHSGPAKNSNINNGPSQHHASNNSLSNVNLQGKPPSPRKGEESDLRSAWNKLYGPSRAPPQPLVRGDNLRASYGQQPNGRSSQQSRENARYDTGPQGPYSRPVSAPAPAHMQVHFQNTDRLRSQFNSQDHIDGRDEGEGHGHPTSQRESPMGQSSSTQGQLEDSSSSQQSGPQERHQNFQNSNLHSNSVSKLESVGYNSHDRTASAQLSPTHSKFAIGPSSKYPEHGSRPSSGRRHPTQPSVNASPLPGRASNKPRTPVEERKVNEQSIDHNANQTKQTHSYFSSALQQNSAKGLHSRGVSFDKNVPPSRSSEKLVDRSHDKSYDLSQDLQDQSIFDYVASHSESSGSMTPPLPPLSPTNTPPDSPMSDRSFRMTRSYSATNMSSSQPMHEYPVESSEQQRDWLRSNPLSQGHSRMDRRPHHKKHRHKRKSKGLSNVDEINSETESNLSFDIDDTILTIDSHDTEQPHPAGDILSSRETNVLRKQLRHLESKYENLESHVEHDSHTATGHLLHPNQAPRPIGRPRRWSIASSDTSSFRREAKFKPGKQILHKHQSKEFKNINKRFQRLESHVVTLARSVAHLSSELRTHNTMVNDVESIKKDLQEIRGGRDGGTTTWPPVLGSKMTEYERFRGWVPSLTNPKRVNKLTKFFGTEPPLLELFLKKLGYEKYVTNFKSEHIGMIELPYMTEERLEKIGVPMGPRLRILQEAQQCFRHENFNIYLV